MKKLIFISIGFFLSVSAFSKDNLQTGTSVSHFYEARSVFTNPAALAFEKELNGSAFLSSLSWGWREKNDDFALGLGWRGLGFGIESLSTDNSEYFNRYSLASSVSLAPWLFLGSRLAFTTSSPSQDGATDLDLGLQVRPSSLFAFGFLLNQVQRDSECVFGVTLRPLNNLTLFADFETLTSRFGKEWTYQGTASYEVLSGLYLQAGYDKLAKAHFGFQLNLGATSLFSVARGVKTERTIVSHAQFSPFEKPSLKPSHDALHLKIDSTLSELGEATSFLSPGNESFSELLLKIKDVENRQEIKAIFIELETFPLGMGAAHELFEALWKARDNGKEIAVSLGNARLKEYLIASAAHSVSIAPSGSLEWIGPKSERYYLKGTLDKTGIKGEFIAQGAYKSAPETFTAKQASQKSRENIFQNLQDAEMEIRKCIQRSGRVTDQTWGKARELGILSSKNAENLKLVDQVLDSHQAQEKLQSTFTLGESRKTSSQSLSLTPKIALVTASGDIVRERVRALSLLGSDQITPDQLGDQFKQIKRDKTIKAVVIRISSGGGDVLASHLIANLIEDLARSKPVIISMGDVAASGGYFISAPSNGIFASPLTLTGSIGVFTGKPNLAGLYKKIDLKKEILSQTPYPGLFSESQEWSKQERAIIERQVREYYQTFIHYVSSHRKIAIESMDSLAQGRVFLGRRAHQGKLLDGLGGFRAALDEAQRQAGVSGAVVKIIYPPSKFLDSLTDFMFVKQSSGLTRSGIGAPAWEALRPGLISEQPYLYWSADSIR